jgi:multicomponent Na+:H+ antiporter subunit B
MNSNSEIVTRMVGLLYPFIIVLGIYVIVNGHLTPGGGFQGGAIIASVFISRYIAFPADDFRIESLQLIEKILFICIILFPILVLFQQWYVNDYLHNYINLIYLISMNIFIGLKVSCGLTIIFLRFIFHEGR